MQFDIQNGMATFTPPVLATGEVTARILGLTVNEWFYVCAILCMLVSAVSSAAVAIIKVKKGDKE